MSARIQAVTMAEIAAKAGVSKATVSRVLGGSSLIGDEVRAEVELIAEELGYVRREVKRHGERSILTVKLVLPPTTNRTARLFYSFGDLVEGLRRGVAPAGVNLIVENSGGGFEPYPHKKGGEVEAFVFAFHAPSAGVRKKVEKAGGVMVVLNRLVSGTRQVISDHGQAMGLIAGHLAERGVSGGCCFVGYEGIEDVVAARVEGFEAGCRVAGIGFERERDVWIAESPEGITGEELKARFERGVRTFVGVNDVAGSLLLQHARAEGYRVPEDVRVTGCDNAAVRGVTVPLLTSVDLSMRDLAEEAGKLIYAEVVDGERRSEEVFVKGSLLEGQTT
ncbi:MAG: LacI family DNA-binding transcriptional regulator [Verrucomicrobiaceae bacterium]